MVSENEAIKVRIKFKKYGSLMYISHLDLSRTMQRIMVRSGIDIWYSEGFNPQPRIVSDVKIGLPINSGCRIECESVLSNKDFKDFIKKSGNVYETSNYSSAQKIIKIEFSGAISDVEIYRY